MDFAVLFAPIATGALDSVESVVPIAIPVLVGLVGITLALKVFGKFGLKR